MELVPKLGSLTSCNIYVIAMGSCRGDALVCTVVRLLTVVLDSHTLFSLHQQCGLAARRDNL